MESKNEKRYIAKHIIPSFAALKGLKFKFDVVARLKKKSNIVPDKNPFAFAIFSTFTLVVVYLFGRGFDYGNTLTQ